jgi:plastocyanin
LAHRVPAALAAALAMLAIPVASAGAATKVVTMGPSAKDAKTINKIGAAAGGLSDVNDFFPHGTTIHVGDSIAFTPAGFHTVNLVARGGTPLPLIVPTGTSVSGSLDAAGNPFWFNGLPALGFNPALLKSKLGKHVSYNGTKAVESGLPLSAKPKAMVVKFTKAGKYTYFCNVHAGMKGVVTVKSSSKAIPSAAADKKTLAKQVKRDIAIAKGLPSIAPPAGTVHVGSAGKDGVEFFGMVPATSTVPVGTTLTFAMTPASREVHTATFGPGNPLTEPTSYLGQIEAGNNDPREIYPSDPPGASASLTPTLHGNGFWNAGALDTVAATPLPSSNSVTFAAPGTYTFYCMIHPFMKGTVVVQ